MARIEFKSVTKRYAGDVIAVDNLALEIREGVCRSARAVRLRQVDDAQHDRGA